MARRGSILLLACLLVCCTDRSAPKPAMSAPERQYYEGYAEKARLRLFADPNDLEALHLLGHALAELGNYDEASQAFDHLQKGGVAAKDLRFEALGYDGLGRVARETGKLELAVERFERAVALAEQQQDRTLLLNVRGNLAYAHLQSGFLDRARPILEEVLEEKRRVGPEHEVMIAATELGGLYSKSGDLERAESLYREAARIAESVQNPRWLETTKRNLDRLRQERAASGR